MSTWITPKSNPRFYPHPRWVNIQLAPTRLASESRNAPEEIRPALKLFQKMEEKKAINTWGAIFYRAICRNEPLLNYLECGTLPANL
jgi:hypothetical protein